MKTIVHTCSSVLTRPNGIVRYINAVMDLQRAMGHRVIFVTDSAPAVEIRAHDVVFERPSSAYVPHMRDGHVWLQVDPSVSVNVGLAFDKVTAPHMIFAHDLHSFMAAESVFTDGVFIQHESDVMHRDVRHSYISDEYLTHQTTATLLTHWRVGSVCRGSGISPQRPIYTPVPFEPTQSTTIKTRDLLYVGDTSDRKGAREFMQMARELGIKPTVITHDTAGDVFAGADVFTFGLDQQQRQFELMAQCKVAYIPSKNECMSLAMLECLQFMPLVLDGQYSYTAGMSEVGADVVCGQADIKRTLMRHIHQQDYTPARLAQWSAHSKQLWHNLSA